jgi:membrane protease YdiL (CAAX protease family)
VGEGARSIRTGERVGVLSVLTLVLALIVFPFLKVQLFEGSAAFYLGAEIAIAVLCIAALQADWRPLDDIGINAPSGRWWVWFGAVVVVAVTIVLLRHVEVINIPAGEAATLLSAHTTAGRFLNLLGVLVGVACEEIIWRGFAVNRLQAIGLPLSLAVLLPSIAFGYFHGGTLDTLGISAGVALSAVALCALLADGQPGLSVSHARRLDADVRGARATAAVMSSALPTIYFLPGAWLPLDHVRVQNGQDAVGVL